MEIEFDPRKNAKNIAERGLSFELANEFDFKMAVTWTDLRFQYPEVRKISMAPLRGRICVLVYIETASGVRVVSLRKANAREISKYEKATALN